MQSDFRRRFRLSAEDAAYIQRKGWEKIREHAEEFVRQRLAPAEPRRDGKQTPMRGHPVFKAQHACACCCRGCLEKWHGIPRGRVLTEREQSDIVELLIHWMQNQPLPCSACSAGPRQAMFDF